MHRLTESHFWYTVILSVWRPWRPPAARWCVRRLSASPSSTSLVCCKRYSSWSIVQSYLLDGLRHLSNSVLHFLSTVITNNYLDCYTLCACTWHTIILYLRYRIIVILKYRIIVIIFTVLFFTVLLRFFGSPRSVVAVTSWLTNNNYYQYSRNKDRLCDIQLQQKQKMLLATRSTDYWVRLSSFMSF